MTNIVPSPFQAGSQELIAKLIRAGYLQPTQSHDAAVVASAIARLKKYLRGAGDDTGPAVSRGVSVRSLTNPSYRE